MMEMNMSAPLSNDYNKKLKTKEIKEKVYQDYCKWIASGKSHKSWYYDQDDLTLTWQTIERYIKEDEDLDPIHKEIAVAKSLAFWEQIGIDMILGKVLHCSPAVYQMIMRNKFGWDKDSELKDDCRGMFNQTLKVLKEDTSPEINNKKV